MEPGTNMLHFEFGSSILHVACNSLKSFLCTHLFVQGEKQPFIRNVFTLDDCAPIVGSDVICFDKKNEPEMLQVHRMLACTYMLCAVVLLILYCSVKAWSDFVQEVDPDIITGYNIMNFDLPYLLNRAKALKVGSHSCLVMLWY